MFTGIVSGFTSVKGVEDRGSFWSMSVDLGRFKEDLEIGASVSIDGVCLTVVSIDSDDVYFDIIEETLNRTTLGNVGVGDYVNVERSLRVGDELGGHILSGHVMTTAKIIEKVENEGSIDLLIENKEEFSDYILEKGYVAIDGMSLTIGEVSEECFSLHIIPETLRVTTIESKSEGDRVNIEIDSRTQAIVDTIRKMGVSS
ncbi:MAG: riboflavin synthase subunit alpha [Candidatus Poseidoniales archaeon]|nr:MAG: riboflavin synthase subunit alpha [Candidatus Poseidoniales archaeon]RCH77143.1 MAG: riboflavin synthase subunit alpha [Candidatus Poseidoniales archaeon]|tara:strand:+ start:5109 stop:5711 length:603 start_codon:yes stop_codon:yes gene_type:complete